MRRIITSLFSVLVAASAMTALTGCGKDRSVGITAASAPAAHLTASFVPNRVDDRWIVGVMSLTNTSNTPITIDNARAGDQNNAFLLSIPGLPTIGSYTGMWNTAVAGKVQQIAPGQTTAFEIKWRLLLPPTPKKDYPWSITIKTSQSGSALPDVVITRPATPEAK